MTPQLDELIRRTQSIIKDRVIRGSRTVLGIVGPPGSGKSTLSDALVDLLADTGVNAAKVPMDGFHLADVELERLGLIGRKGAIETFDVWGYRSLLERVRQETDVVVYAPDFGREIEQPIAGSIPVLPSHSLVVTEGNYLLSELPPWAEVRSLIDEIWYCDLESDVRIERLVKRHENYGKTRSEARNWVEMVDEPNALSVMRFRSEADVIVNMNDLNLK